MTHCLNCGTDFEGNFCPKCGQSAKVKRLTFRGVFIESLWDIVSMDSGMFYTMFMLVTKPWKVISEYIHGRRASYTKPVQLVLVTIVLVALASSIPGLGTIEPDVSVIREVKTHDGIIGAVWDSIFQFVCDSKITQECIFSLVAAAICWLVYLPFGSRRFNLVEYCCAYFYWSSMTTVINLVCLPLKFLDEELLNTVSGIWILLMSAILVFRAFPIRRRWLRVTMFFIVSLTFCLALFFLIALFMGIDYFLGEEWQAIKDIQN